MAIVGLLLLVMATIKVFWWLSVRLMVRQKYYECTRGRAGRAEAEKLQQDFKNGIAPTLDKVWWDNEWTHRIDGLKLHIFGGEVDVPPLPDFC